MKALKILTAAMILLVAVPFSTYAGNNLKMDFNNDGVVDIFDMIKARKSGASTEELHTLGSFLLGNEVEALSDNSYDLIWSDEFNDNKLDESKWAYELGNWKLDDNGNYVTNGWGNNEQEFYTSRNTEVKDGILTIAARKESWVDEKQGSYDYTSARINTQHKFSVCGGRIEVRARCDSGKSQRP